MKIILMIFQKKFLLQAKGYFELIHCFFVFYARRFWMKVILHIRSVVPIIFLLFFYYQLEAIIYSLSYILSTPTEVVLKRKFTLLSEKNNLNCHGQNIATKNKKVCNRKDLLFYYYFYNYNTIAYLTLSIVLAWKP